MQKKDGALLFRQRFNSSAQSVIANFELRLFRGAQAWVGHGDTYGLRQVLVRDDLSPAQRVKTSLHELGHIRCGHLGDDQDGVIRHRGRCETEAESVAHVVCAALGLDTAAYSDAYVLDWASGDIGLVKQTADTVLRVAKAILGDLTGEPADDDTASPPCSADQPKPALTAAPH